MKNKKPKYSRLSALIALGSAAVVAAVGIPVSAHAADVMFQNGIKSQWIFADSTSGTLTGAKAAVVNQYAELDLSNRYIATHGIYNGATFYDTGGALKEIHHQARVNLFSRCYWFYHTGPQLPPGGYQLKCWKVTA